MITPVVLSEQLLFTTVRIEVETKRGELNMGTAFFFRFRAEDKGVFTTLITNKHVIKNARVIRFLVHIGAGSESEFKPSGLSRPIMYTDPLSAWIEHPDPAIDLAGMPFNPIDDKDTGAPIPIYNRTVSEKFILSPSDWNELSAIEEVCMVGYPTGLWDSTNNLPVVRRGITATHPAVDFCGRPEFMIDAACFPGSSGSPVFLLSTGMHFDKAGQLSAPKTRFAFLGVLYAGPFMTAEGKIVARPIPTGFEPVASTSVPIHLGYVIKSTEVVTLGRHIWATLKPKP